MNQIVIASCVTTYPDGSAKTRIRKAILDSNGRVAAKYFLTNYGEWKEVPAHECIPDECVLETSIHEKAQEVCIDAIK